MTDKGQLFFNGDIVTMDEARPQAEAVAVRAGLIVAVGSRAACESALDHDFEKIDLAGGALLPGFIDTHLHPTGMVTYEMFGNLSRVKSIAELQAELKKTAAEIPAPGWVVGLQFEDQDLAESRLPTRHDLDAACPDRPAIVVKADGHMVIANTAAIKQSGAAASTPDPAGGLIDREPGGHPAGPFRETAAEIPLSAMPMPDVAMIRKAAHRSFQTLAAHGITSAGAVLQTDSEGVFGKQGAFDVLLMNALLDIIPQNLTCHLVARELAPVEAAKKTGLNQDRVSGQSHRIGGIKFWADGTFGSCTAFMNAPFSDHPDQIGFLVLPEDEMHRRMSMAHRAGMQVLVHVIGDAAGRVVVDLFEQVLREHPRKDHRHRIEHASTLDPELLADIARLGLVISTQPLFIRNEKNWLEKRLGAERLSRVYPFRAILEAGIPLAGASDGPICSTNVLHAVHCAVTRDGFVPEQALTPEQALRMFTTAAAFAQFEENVKGSIAPGKRADLVILSANPLRVPADEIGGIAVLRAICGGKVIHPAGGE